MGLKEIVFPVRHDRPFGLASASFLLLVVFAEIEALALIALGLIAHRMDLFLDLQVAIAPAAFLVAVVSAVVIWIQQRAVGSRMRRYTAEMAATRDISGFAERLASRRPQR